MRIVSIVQQKGGEGKTTVAMSLADSLSKSGSRVLVVDVDPQQSSAWWFEHGPDLGFDLTADTDANNLVRLRELTDYDVIVIDSPGSLHDLTVLDAVLDVTDFAILPSRASALSIAPLTRTLNEHVIPRSLPYRVLANRVDPRSVDAGEYRGARDLYELLDGAGYSHFKAFLREYKVYEDAAAEGQSVLDFPPTWSRGTVKAQNDLAAVSAELLTVWANSTTTERAHA